MARQPFPWPLLFFFAAMVAGNAGYGPLGLVFLAAGVWIWAKE